MKTHGKTFIFLLAALTVAFLACNSNKNRESDTDTAQQAEKPARPNVIVLLVDTLRADFVGAYGAKHPTPVMDMLAGQGVTFEKAYATSSWTVPSVATLFTGMYPQKHGLTEGIAAAAQVFNQQAMPEGYVTLAESFKADGYTTFCLTNNSHISETYGYNAGFDFFQMNPFSNGDVLESSLKDWSNALADASAKTGYFLFLHWVDPHHPYEAREPYITNIRPNYMEQLGRTLDDAGPAGLMRMGYFKEHPEKMEVMKDLYNSEVLWTDDSLGRVIKTLPHVGQSLVVFTSDHGEAFSEHDSMVHGVDLYQETVHVPLIMVFPDNRKAGTRIAQPVSLVDLPRTLLSFAKIKPPKDYEGVDLLPLISSGKLAKRYLYAHLDKAQVHRWKVVYDKNLKLAIQYATDGQLAKAETNGSEPPERTFLFDLDKDPGETKNLLKDEPKKVKELLALLDKQVKEGRCTPGEAVKNDREVKVK